MTTLLVLVALIAVAIASYFLISTLLWRRTVARRQARGKASLLAARARIQNAQWLADDERGTYGGYRPARPYAPPDLPPTTDPR
ncbi:hypothetical protein [Rhodococcus sp. NPDC058521]|uniref:hypothetical protein n=1 Tax=Rhodococcus sp. NPDC058521 TaxID=3346536 RepID=UPI003655DCBD